MENNKLIKALKLTLLLCSVVQLQASDHDNDIISGDAGSSSTTVRVVQNQNTTVTYELVTALENSQKQLLGAAVTIRDTKIELDVVKKRIDTIESEKTESEKILNETRKQLEQLERLDEEKKTEIGKLAAKISAEEQKVQDLSAQLEEGIRQENDLTSQLETLGDENDSLLKQIAALTVPQHLLDKAERTIKETKTLADLLKELDQK